MKSTLRRVMYASGLLASGCFGGVSASQAAEADAPKQTVTVPGVERRQVGEFEVFALSDRRLMIDAGRLARVPQHEWPQALARSFQRDPALQSVTAYAIRKAGQVVLINAGRGAKQGQDFGQVAENLKSVGIAPEDISAVFLTCMKADQVGGLLAPDEQRQFPHAKLLASSKALAYWLADHNYVHAPDAQKLAFATTITSVMPYVKAGQLQAAEDGLSLMPGLSIAPTHGTTPGCVEYGIESKGQKLSIVGDQGAGATSRRPRVVKSSTSRRAMADAYAHFPGWQQASLMSKAVP